MSSEQWVRDLVSLVNAVPFGNVEPLIVKKERKVAEIVLNAHETVKYKDNDTAFRDIVAYLANLEHSRFSGAVSFVVEYNEGKIKQSGFNSSKRTKYG